MADINGFVALNEVKIVWLPRFRIRLLRQSLTGRSFRFTFPHVRWEHIGAIRTVTEMDGPQQISMLRPSNTTEESSGDITQQQSAAAASLIFVHSCLLALDKGTVDQVKARLK